MSLKSAAALSMAALFAAAGAAHADIVHFAATLTDAQIADLVAGKWYFNIHTAANPGGEVRGQVTKQ